MAAAERASIMQTMALKEQVAHTPHITQHTTFVQPTVIEPHLVTMRTVQGPHVVQPTRTISGGTISARPVVASSNQLTGSARSISTGSIRR